MLSAPKATGWVFYKDDWWEVLKEETDGFLVVLGKVRQHITLKELGFHDVAKRRVGKRKRAGRVG